MSDATEETPASGAVKKTISLPDRVFRFGEEEAARRNRSFSNYIATLILADQDGKEIAAKPEEANA